MAGSKQEYIRAGLEEEADLNGRTESCNGGSFLDITEHVMIEISRNEADSINVNSSVDLASSL